jgi:hypothetical protein
VILWPGVVLTLTLATTTLVVVARSAEVTGLAERARLADGGSADGDHGLQPVARATTVAAAQKVGPSPAYADGAPPGFSGGFDEQSCHACHFFNDVNSGPERVAITGVPERFVAGEAYPLTITLSRPDLKVAGFQLTARFRDDGAQAGELAPASGAAERVKVETQGDVQYANQQKAGTEPAAPHTARWSLVWTAPDGDRPVVFHVAANAGDGDGTAEGDYVETAEVEVRPAGLSAGQP